MTRKVSRKPARRPLRRPPQPLTCRVEASFVSANPPGSERLSAPWSGATAVTARSRRGDQRLALAWAA